MEPDQFELKLLDARDAEQSKVDAAQKAFDDYRKRLNNDMIGELFGASGSYTKSINKYEKEIITLQRALVQIDVPKQEALQEALSAGYKLEARADFSLPERKSLDQAIDNWLASLRKKSATEIELERLIFGEKEPLAIAEAPTNKKFFEKQDLVGIKSIYVEELRIREEVLLSLQGGLVKLYLSVNKEAFFPSQPNKVLLNQLQADLAKYQAKVVAHKDSLGKVAYGLTEQEIENEARILAKEEFEKEKEEEKNQSQAQGANRRTAPSYPGPSKPPERLVTQAPTPAQQFVQRVAQQGGTLPPWRDPLGAIRRAWDRFKGQISGSGVTQTTVSQTANVTGRAISQTARVASQAGLAAASQITKQSWGMMLKKGAMGLLTRLGVGAGAGQTGGKVFGATVKKGLTALATKLGAKALAGVVSGGVGTAILIAKDILNSEKVKNLASKLTIAAGGAILWLLLNPLAAVGGVTGAMLGGAVLGPAGAAAGFAAGAFLGFHLGNIAGSILGIGGGGVPVASGAMVSGVAPATSAATISVGAFTVPAGISSAISGIGGLLGGTGISSITAIGVVGGVSSVLISVFLTVAAIVAVTPEEKKDGEKPPVTATQPYGYPARGKITSLDAKDDHWSFFYPLNKRFDGGMDIALAGGNVPVYSTVDGTIMAADFIRVDYSKDESLKIKDVGGVVYVQSNDGKYVVEYKHLDSSAKSLSTGQKVGRGDLLGKTYPNPDGDKLGAISGPHVHYQIVFNGGNLNFGGSVGKCSEGKLLPSEPAPNKIVEASTVCD
jgi:murein DD-endopeptidase MepM/ murein hydrolase activator NlpD